MNNKKPDASELEAELLRLNTLVRQRRAQLARLEKCPHKDCECRLVWRQVMEKDLATQVRRIRRGVTRNGTQPRKASARGASRSRK
jgi:hypothetical protein